MLNYIIITYLLINVFIATAVLIVNIADNGIDKTPQQFIDFLLICFFGIPIIIVGYVVIIIEEMFGDNE